MKTMEKESSPISGVVNALGLVFGDIGTSPIYTFTVIALLTKPTEKDVIGLLSLIAWTLIILVMLEYAWLAMNLSKKGEGGTVVLKEILTHLLKSRAKAAVVGVLSIIGISLLIGDGVITPAISILSAVEGIRLIPSLGSIKTEILLAIAAAIAILLFAYQSKGPEKVAKAFGPLMVVWFISLAVSGLISLMEMPSVLKALNPYYGIRFLLGKGIGGFLILAEVTLCATGGEALYADMGQLGRRPILRAWYLVFFALLINYFGQGVFMIHHPEAKNVLFEMVLNQSRLLFIPFLVVGIIATVIASQSMISGMFSIVYQGITTHVIPLLKVDYTSSELKSQIYIGFVNWTLLVAVLIVMAAFRESSNLAAAYGLAVTGTMTLTGVFMTWIFYLKRRFALSFISFAVACVDMIFFISNTFKIPHGGYWSILIALIPFTTIMVYAAGQKKLIEHDKHMPLKEFLKQYESAYKEKSKIEGTALFFARGLEIVPAYVTGTMIKAGIIYEDNVVVSIIRLNEPFGVIASASRPISTGLRHLTIKMGYMEVFDMDEVLRANGIDEKTIFYGTEEIVTKNFIWKIFSVIKRLTPSFVQFYKLPADKLRGVVTRVEM